MGMPASPDTLLRRIRQAPTLTAGVPRVLPYPVVYLAAVRCRERKDCALQVAIAVLPADQFYPARLSQPK